MSIESSGAIANRVKLRSVAIAVILHLVIASLTMGLWLIWVAIACVATHLIVQRETESVAHDGSSFKKTYPLRRYGSQYSSFEHVFSYEQALGPSLVAAIDQALSTNMMLGPLKPTTITDVDPDLRAPESRTYLFVGGDQTKRGTDVSLFVFTTELGRMQSIQWWVTAGGYLDKDKTFNFVALSPITLLFWLIPYTKHEYDVLSQVRTIHSSTYNNMDVLTHVRCLHETVFNALVEELEKHGIDTSTLRLQRAQVMNIAVSGGKVSMGNVVQGAMNRVVAGMQGTGRS